ncbi:methylamine utilization protein [Thauera sp.]|uniref:methylamine utilization protein n=1 Tax=Thauera sp. TaxID=1905334 RepID=UPI002C876109|nr:methylamine utilization protein [Thauera sp.]HRP23157.1 methylamine utilization protein [Thauera sp.]
MIKLALQSSQFFRLCGALLGLLAAHAAGAADVRVKVVDPQGMPLEHAAVALKPQAGGAPARSREVDIVQQEKRFLPLMTAVRTGTAVRFPNLDTVRHHVYSFSPAKSFELKLYIGTPAAPVVFDTPGVVVMGCNIHDTMVGYVVVSDAPWVGVSDGQGSVRFEGIPAGEYELEYWHPRWVGAVNEVVRQRLQVAEGVAATPRLVIGERP